MASTPSALIPSALGQQDLKPSKYNYLVARSEGLLAYNFFSGALAEFDAESWRMFKGILRNVNRQLTPREEELRDQMVELGFLLSADCDELQVLRFRYNFFRLDR